MEDIAIMNKIQCNLSTEELRKAYIDEKRTLEDMREIVGAKSVITVRKILNSHGISTNNNQRLKEKSMHGMDEDEFKKYLIDEYESGKSMDSIGAELNVTASCVRKYFVKYGISRRGRADHFKERPENNPRYIGKERIIKEGYYMVRCPEHPKAKNGFVYEHRLVIERKNKQISKER